MLVEKSVCVCLCMCVSVQIMYPCVFCQEGGCVLGELEED